jgi:putative ABC transport system permease protein
MFRNTLITGYRYLLRHPLYAVINLAGLSIAMTSVILIMLYVMHENNYDKQHKDGETVVRLVQGKWGLHSPSLKYDLNDLSFIQHSARVDIMYGKRMSVRYNEKLINMQDIIFTDPEIFSIMDYEFVAGNETDALTNPFSMVLTESMAATIFGDEDPIGKVIRTNNKHLFTITAVIKDISHSHLSFNGIAIFEDIPAMTNQEDFLKRVGHWNFNYYLRLAEGTSHQQAIADINAHLTGRQSWVESGEPAFWLQPIDAVYFDQSIDYEMGIVHGNRTMVHVFLVVAFIIMMLALINFINITTANATNRAKETGVRKVIGSSKAALVVQYTSEAILISLAAMLIALLLVEISLPTLRALLQKDLMIDFLYPATLLLLIGGASLLGLLAGLFPAYLLSAFKPVEVLKGFSDRTSGKASLRSILTVLQFVISITLISTTIIVYQQVDFMNSKSLGINIENMAYSRVSPDIQNAKSAFKEKLMQHPGITAVAYTNAIPGGITWQESIKVDGESRQYTFLPTTYEFLQMIELPISEGRQFSNSIADEAGSIIINRAAAAYFGWEEPLGHTEQTTYRGALKVVGITEDFHFNDVSQSVGPLMIALNDESSFILCFKIDPNIRKDALAHFEESWVSFSPEFPVEYRFVEEAFTSFYQEQGVQMKVFVLFSILSIIIAALGLYGMAAYMANRKRREVCIRKIHGAGLESIYLMLSLNMLKLVALAFIIACPIAWYMVNQWLQGFPYQIAIDWWVFGIAGMISIIISQLTITGQVFRVARVNPAEALRYE